MVRVMENVSLYSLGRWSMTVRAYTTRSVSKPSALIMQDGI